MSILSSCTNYQSFGTRKYLPKFKKSSQTEIQIEAQQKNSESLAEHSSTFKPIQVTDSLNKVAEPILLADLTNINKSNKIETKKTRQWDNNWNYNNYKTNSLPKTPEGSENKKIKKLSLFAKILYSALIIYFFFLTTFLIYLIEGSGTNRFKTSLRASIVFFSFAVLCLFVLIFLLIDYLILGWGAVNFAPTLMTILLIGTIIYFVINVYLGIKTVLKN